MISSGLSGMELWDVFTGQLIATFKSNKWLGAVTFSPDGRYAAVSSEKAVAIWDISAVARGGVYHESESTTKLYGYSPGELRTLGGNVTNAYIAYFSSGGDKLKIAYYRKLFEYSLMTGANGVKAEIDNTYYMHDIGRRYLRIVEAKNQNPMNVIIDTRTDREILRRPLEKRMAFHGNFFRRR